MKKYFLIVTILFLLLITTGCKNCFNKDSIFLSEEEIKSNYNSFDATVDFNGLKFRLIKTSKGYYYENTSNKQCIFYNRDENKSYIIDNELKQKTLVEGNYDLSEYLNTVYYILTYHLRKESIQEYETQTTNYINRSVNEYYREEGDVIEKYYIDSELGGCLYFLIDNGTQRVVCKIESIKLGRDYLDQYESYYTLENADISVFKSENTVLNNLSSYDITFSANGKEWRIIKSSEGFYCSTKDEKTMIAELYDHNTSKWYRLDLENKTKIVTNDSTNINEFEINLFKKGLLMHLSEVSNDFFVGQEHDILDLLAKEYLKESSKLGISISDKFYINIENGICLKRVVNGKTIFEVTSITFNGSVNEYINYENDKNQTYQEWPTEHEYLEGIEPLTHGTFFVGYQDDKELTIVYKEFKSSFVDSVVNYFKEVGFVIDEKQFEEFDTDFTYLFYQYEAVNEKNHKLLLQYDKETEMLTFTISTIE